MAGGVEAHRDEGVGRADRSEQPARHVVVIEIGAVFVADPHRLAAGEDDALVVDGDMVVAVDRKIGETEKARPHVQRIDAGGRGAVFVSRPAAAARRIARFVQRDRSAICHIELVLRRRAGPGEGAKRHVEAMHAAAEIDCALGVPAAVRHHEQGAGVAAVAALLPAVEIHRHGRPEPAQRIAELIAGVGWDARDARQPLIDEGRALEDHGLLRPSRPTQERGGDHHPGKQPRRAAAPAADARAHPPPFHHSLLRWNSSRPLGRNRTLATADVRKMTALISVVRDGAVGATSTLGSRRAKVRYRRYLAIVGSDTNLSSATSHKPWRRRRPSAQPARCRSGDQSCGTARRPARS